MIHIVFGLVGFCWNGGKVKGYRHENKDAYVFCAFFGLFGIIAWNFNGMQLWMRVFRLAVDDAVLLEKFHETLDERVKKGMKEREEAMQRDMDFWKDRYSRDREQTQKLLSEANTRCHDLETALKVLTGYPKLPIGL